MANTYTLIASNTVGLLGASSITFSSIPSTYTDLLLKSSARSAIVGGRDDAYINFNGSIASTYQTIRLRGADGGSYSNNSGANVAPASTYPLEIPGSTATASTFSNDDIYIPNYTGSQAKSYSVDSTAENNSTVTWQVTLSAGITTATSAITSITYTATSGNLVQYSTFYLYGIKSS